MMTVKEIWQGETISLQPENEKYVMSEMISNEKAAKLFFQGISCNTTGTSEASSATEKAMLQMLDKFGCSYTDLRLIHCKDPLVRFQFTSKRKKMSTVLTGISDNEYGYDKRLHTKGAAEIVLKTCSHFINEDGRVELLTDDMKSFIISSVIEEFAKNALRTICLAYKDLQVNEGGPNHEDDDPDNVNKAVEKEGLTCIAILGIRDIIRPEVPEAVKTCQKAGIKVRMVTGDNKITALAIAKECGIITEETEGCVLEGPEFYQRVGGLIEGNFIYEKTKLNKSSRYKQTILCKK